MFAVSAIHTNRGAAHIIAQREAERRAAIKSERDRIIAEGREKQRLADEQKALEAYRVMNIREVEFANPDRPTAKEIIQSVVCGTMYTYADIIGNRRYKELVQLRAQAIKKVAMLRPDMSLPQIGRAFGGKDHTSILHSLNKSGIVGRRTIAAPVEAKIDIDAVIARKNNGEFYKDIASEYGISQERLRGMVQRHSQTA